MKFGRFFRPAAFFSFLGMLFPLVLNSCSQISGAINEPVREYFERGSTVTQIVSHEILSGTTGAPAATAKDKNGHICVGSVSDIKVKLHVNNPMNYTFTEGSNLSYYLVDSTSAALTDADSISLNMTSSTEWELTYPASFLTAAEYGKNISVRIDLSHPETGTAFPSYTVPLYCNSVPPLIGNAVTYTKTVTASGQKTYVVCFTIAPLNPLTSNDLKYLKIGSTTILISVSSSIISSADTKLHSSNINAVTPPPGCTYQPNGQAFPIGVPNQSFYYETNDPVTTDKAYTISLIDEAGLTSSATTAANSYTIAATTLIDSAGTSHAGALAPDIPTTADEIKLGQDEDSSYAKVKIKVPTSATGPVTKSISGVTVEYTVTESATPATPVFEGTTTSDYNLNLAPGTYTIVCTATKDGYTTSETTFSVKVIATKVYVKSDGDDIDGDGTKEHPYKTIHQADTKLPSASEAGDAIRTIFVLDDLGIEQHTTETPSTITISNTDCINCQNHTLTDVQLSIGNGCVIKNATIAGTDEYKQIVGSNKELENVILAKPDGVDAVTGTTTKLKNVTSTNNNIINSANITIKGKIVGLTLNLTSSSKKLTIAGNMSGSSNNKIVLTNTYDTVTAGHPRVFTTGYGTYNTAAPSTYFTSDFYGIIKTTVTGGTTEEAALAVSGGSISVYTPDRKLTLEATPNSIAPTGDTTIVISADGTLASGTIVHETDDEFSDWDIKAYYEYDYRHASPSAAPTPAAVPAAATPFTLTFPAGYPAGNYVIVIFVTFNGTRYSCEMVVNKP